jgi:hypothetical protein
MPAVPSCRRMDDDLLRIHEMEGASQGLDHGLLDRPEQSGCLSQISARQPQGMVKLLRLEDPAKGVSSWEFIGPGHIDADVGLISTESSPDFSTTRAEGDGRTQIFSQPEMGPAKQAADYLKGESSSAGGLIAFSKRTFHRHKVIPQGGDEAVFVSCPVCSTPFGGFVGPGHGCVEDGSPSLKGTQGMNG